MFQLCVRSVFCSGTVAKAPLAIHIRREKTYATRRVSLVDRVSLDPFGAVRRGLNDIIPNFPTVKPSFEFFG